MDYHVALYIRLSKRDENEGPLQRVTNQKSLLNDLAFYLRMNRALVIWRRFGWRNRLRRLA